MQEIIELLRCELRSSVRPQDIKDGSTAEGLSEGCNQFWGGGVMVHWKNGWPVSVAINYNKVIMASVSAEVHCNLLKWPVWFGSDSFVLDGRQS